MEHQVKDLPITLLAKQGGAMHKLERILTGIALVVGLLSGLVLLNVGKTSTLEEVCIASLFGSFIVISLTLYDQVLVKLDTPFWKTWHNYWRS